MKKGKTKDAEREIQEEAARQARIKKNRFNSSWLQNHELVGKTVDSLNIIEGVFDALF
jgi:hypothetical protein